jgi:hypothetical protein
MPKNVENSQPIVLDLELRFFVDRLSTGATSLLLKVTLKIEQKVLKKQL